MKRFNIIGTSGSGKTTLARKIASIVGAHYIELDKLFWRQNWSHLEDDEFFKDLETELSRQSWVLDGNYSRTIPIKWSGPLTVVWIDLPFWKTVFQAVARASKRAWTKEELWEGTNNRESFRKSFFSRDSIIWWCIKNYYKNRKKNQSYFENLKYGHINFIKLKSHREADLFLKDLKRQIQG